MERKHGILQLLGHGVPTETGDKVDPKQRMLGDIKRHSHSALPLGQDLKVPGLPLLADEAQSGSLPRSKPDTQSVESRKDPSLEQT